MKTPIPISTPNSTSASARLAVAALMAALAGAPAAGQTSLDRVLDNAQAQPERVKISVQVLTTDGDPLPGIRVNYENVGSGNRMGWRVSGDDGKCEDFWVPRGTSFEVGPASDRFYFGESGSDGVVKTTMRNIATRDFRYFFRGSDRVRVPDLGDESLANAQSRTRDAGLTLSYTQSDPCAGTLNHGSIATCRARVDRVYRQNPAPGTRVAAYSRVEARVGIWPASREVPQVSFGFEREGSALTPQEACHRLQRAGFLTRVSNVLQRGCTGGNVVRQNPAGGTTAAYGSVVELVLCNEGPHQVALGRNLECTPRAPAP